MSIRRNITTIAENYLATPEILLFIGARQAGKTTILKQIQAFLIARNSSTHFINLEDPDYLSLLNKSPKNLLNILNFNLKQKTYVFIDEIQYLNNPSNFLKYFYDEYTEKIKLIVSGSSAFYIDEKFKDSLAGRKKIFNVRTLSFQEFLRFKKEDVLAEKNLKKLSLNEKEKINFFYQEFITYGGYPRVVLADLNEKVNILQELAYSYTKKDIYDAGVKKSEIFYKLFKILASNTGQLVNSSELSSTLGVSKTMIERYLFIMQKSFHIQLVKPFFKNIRKELTKMPKVYFYDLGLRNFFVNNFNKFLTREDKGQLLENTVFRQLAEKYNENEINYWRTTEQNEVDFIVGGKIALEVKINPAQFKKSKYKVFFDNYPHIKFIVVSLAKTQTKASGRTIKNAWEI